jgi:spore germination cell wall hydrolase CwlJ-like protein
LTLLPASYVFAADYTVVTNDSLYKIGQVFQISADTIKMDNSLSANTIYPGQVLYVPAKKYTVKTGDTLYLIAKSYGLPLTSLQKANDIWDNRLMPGQQIMLPGIAPEAGSDTVIPYTQAEVDLLARLIEAEAVGEIYQAKVAVGAVVVNRVQSSDWPSTITGVINQVINGYYQFTPVKNGMINQPASDDSVRAAWSALFGSDPSIEAIFYYDDSSTSQYMLSKIRTKTIDSLIFAK